MKTRSFMLLVFFMLSFMPVGVQAKKANDDAIRTKVAAMTQEQKTEEVAQMQERAKEILAMNISKMSAEERKSLRDEVKNMRKEAKEISGNGGVYISVGALLIIILLLIILL